MHRLTAPIGSLFQWLAHKLRFLKILNPKKYIKRIDWYIIKKFIGTYIFSIALIIAIAIVFDLSLIHI